MCPLRFVPYFDLSSVEQKRRDALTFFLSLFYRGRKKNAGNSKALSVCLRRSFLSFLISFLSFQVIVRDLANNNSKKHGSITRWSMTINTPFVHPHLFGAEHSFLSFFFFFFVRMAKIGTTEKEKHLLSECKST